MKKTIALLFILVANIILVAHAVIPHHDHENMLICFIVSHCSDLSDAHSETDCETPAHHTNQDNDCSDKCCCIDTVFDPSDNKERTICCTHSKYECQHTSYILIASTIDLQAFRYDSFFSSPNKPFIVSCHIDYISQSQGLRAPPAC
jgi:hypothetical protein